MTHSIKNDTKPSSPYEFVIKISCYKNSRNCILIFAFAYIVAMYEPPKPKSKIIIVGAGCFGLSTAYALSKDKVKNYDIWVYDRGTIPIPDAASTGTKSCKSI
jgi:hypothetical protein